MSLDFASRAIDLGIVTNNADAMLGFYRDLLGFEEEPSTPFPMGGTMYRLWCGDSLIKIVAPDAAPEGKPPAGAIAEATGYRYWTIRLKNVEEVVAKCEAAGVQIVVPMREARPGVTICIVADPDGNLLEFVRYS